LTGAAAAASRVGGEKVEAAFFAAADAGFAVA